VGSIPTSGICADIIPGFEVLRQRGESAILVVSPIASSRAAGAAGFCVKELASKHATATG
jgi:hypothetical protein